MGKRSHTWKNTYYMSPLMWSSTLIKNVRDFPGGPVVRTPCFHCRGLRVVPGEGIKIPQAVWHNQDKWKLKIKNPQTNAGEDVERREPFCIVGGNVNWHGHYGEQYGGSLKNSYHMTLEPHSWAYIQRKTWPEKIHVSPMFTASLFTMAKIWKQLNIHPQRNGFRRCGIYRYNRIIPSH